MEIENRRDWYLWLRKTIPEYRTRYFAGDPAVPDSQYDYLVADMKRIEAARPDWASEQIVQPTNGIAHANGVNGAAVLHTVAAQAPPVPPPPPVAPPDVAPSNPGDLRPSYLVAVKIFEHNFCEIVDGPLGFNEMTCSPTMGGLDLEDHHLTTFRSEIERRISGGKDGRGDKQGLKLKYTDICQAVLQVARKNSYHPVRQYLKSLKWDGAKRIERVAAEVLRAANTPINNSMIRRWFVSAVARPMRPGCKVDTMLVLVGDQGFFKSTFFNLLASEEFFCDTKIDLQNKDAYLTLRGAWILEFAELRSLRSKRDNDDAKGFLSSKKDTYRLPYGRLNVTVRRSGVIGGTTNKREFLDDETGERRYWPIECYAKLNIDLLKEWRDQLWAEAVVAYENGEQWWFTSEEEAQIAVVHERHSIADTWTEPVLDWLENPVKEEAETRPNGSGGFTVTQVKRAQPRTTANVLQHALGMSFKEKWTRREENRIGAIATAAGWVSDKPHRGARIWVKVPPLPVKP